MKDLRRLTKIPAKQGLLKEASGALVLNPWVVTPLRVGAGVCVKRSFHHETPPK